MNNPLLIPGLQYILPGFVSIWIFYGLTSYPKPSTSNQIIQALMFTFIIQSIKKLLDHCFEIQDYNFILPLILAILLGISFSWLANNDWCHRILRKLKITKETSYFSEWYSAVKDSNSYMILHLRDKKRIQGYPKEWPKNLSEGQFLLQDARWLDENNNEIDLPNIEIIMIKAEDIKMVEQMKKSEETKND